MRKISFWKKLSLYMSFRRTILQNKDELLQSFNIRIDSVSRIYTVINIPKKIIDEKEPYTSELTKKYIEEYTSMISGFLGKKGLHELCSVYAIRQVEAYSYLLVIGFKFFDSAKMFRKFMYRYIPIGILLILFSIYFMLY